MTSPFATESWTYSYDELHRLTSATTQPTGPHSQTFQYDNVGNVTFNSLIGSYAYPVPGSTRPHAPSTVAGDPLTYDSNGNLTAGRSRSIQWNADNLATAINSTQMFYDATGDRVKKATGTSTSLYPFGDDYEITNGVITKYFSVEGLGTIAKRVGTQTFWIHADRLGSIQAITDAAGASAQRRTYRPYGDKIADVTSHTESRGYIAERQDVETGLAYLHARYYDSALGIFLSPDPLGSFGSRNGFCYSGGDPVNRRDITGLDDDPVFNRDEGDQNWWHWFFWWLSNRPAPSAPAPKPPDGGGPTPTPSPTATPNPTPTPEPTPNPTCEGPKCPRFHETVDVVAEAPSDPFATLWAGTVETPGRQLPATGVVIPIGPYTGPSKPPWIGPGRVLEFKRPPTRIMNPRAIGRVGLGVTLAYFDIYIVDCVIVQSACASGSYSPISFDDCMSVAAPSCPR